MSCLFNEQPLPQLLTKESQFMNHLVKSIYDERRKAVKTCIVRPGDKVELVFRSFLYEDKKMHPVIPGEA